MSLIRGTGMHSSSAGDFVWGGMENTSATTMTRGSLFGEDGSQDGLIAHELGHQWFGDLITCKGWEHPLAERRLGQLLRGVVGRRGSRGQSLPHVAVHTSASLPDSSQVSGSAIHPPRPMHLPW
jgi:hypothetical protein